MRTAGLILSISLISACVKVPISDIEARFDLADATWFAEEQTLFFFYELSAEQGLSDKSVIEVTYRTDDEVVPWTIIEDLEWVHTHVPVDCGFTRRCGSLSLHVPIEPRDVDIRLRYHVDGSVVLSSTASAYNIIGPGPAHTNRSLIVYGVFAEDNRAIQWRGRHRFPTLRNEKVTELGLRRQFRVEDQRYGTTGLDTFDGNAYGYATGCPTDFVETSLAVAETQDRAIFNVGLLTLDASTEAHVCAKTTVHEPVQPFVSTAFAQKNPEVDPAFPVLRTPVQEATPIKFFLKPCNRTISDVHEQMQRQRIQYDGPPRCIDDWQRAGFVDDFVAELRDAVEQTRPGGRDMVLVIGLHRDENGVADKVEQALAQVVPPERDKSTPRLAGAWVFDSEIRDIADPALGRLILWCPAQIIDEDTIEIPNPSQIGCAITPDNTSFTLGPFMFSGLPILPSRSRYLDFLNDFSDAQAGRVEQLTFLAPELTPTTDNTEVMGIVATFFNGERVTAEDDDVFSYCAPQGLDNFVFRTPFTQMLPPCMDGQDPNNGDLCLPMGIDFLPIQFMPDWHEVIREQTYELGILWDFPWLLRMMYEIVGAANAGAFGLSVPFGFGADAQQDLGTPLWTLEEFDLSEILLQCRRFCDHPTFDSAGVYNVLDSFRDTYRTACYLPLFPAPGDSSFPRDP